MMTCFEKDNDRTAKGTSNFKDLLTFKYILLHLLLKQQQKLNLSSAQIVFSKIQFYWGIICINIFRQAAKTTYRELPLYNLI